MVIADRGDDVNGDGDDVDDDDDDGVDDADDDEDDDDDVDEKNNLWLGWNISRICLRYLWYSRARLGPCLVSVYIFIIIIMQFQYIR